MDRLVERRASGSGATRAPLAAYPRILTRDLDELRKAVTPLYGEGRFSVPRGARLDVTANHCTLGAVALTYATHGTPIDITIPQLNAHAELFAMAGRAEARAGRTRTEVGARSAHVGSAGCEQQLRYGADFVQFVLRVDADALARKAEVLIGETLGCQLKFEPQADLAQAESGRLWRLCLQLAAAMDGAGPLDWPETARAELEQAILITFLNANRGNASHRLDHVPAASAPWHVLRTEAYIEANWDRPVTIEDLAAETGLSARSLFLGFRRARGCSPIHFARQVRLRRARDLLQRPGPATSVTGVAFDCGFGNLGHFAAHYRRAFGETPSQALRRALQQAGIR